jgi:hypothetical protein
MLSEEDKRRIDAEEAYRLETRRRLEATPPPLPNARRARPWIKWIAWCSGLLGLLVITLVLSAPERHLDYRAKREHDASVDRLLRSGATAWGRVNHGVARFRGKALIHPGLDYFDVEASDSVLKCYGAERPAQGALVTVRGPLKDSWPPGTLEMRPCTILARE